ncbi:Inner membrane protein ybaN [Actinobacillus ureae]|uniref:YbaN family protein n=1 Tax=Actinobacillus ureae TaxID=723 RepID=UPI000E1A3EA4|nr:YbaN family protein [Actinobacillus ureae]SUT87615.1 Inner membrane protein ybaN [Actinobacillus ureae]SUU49162.1 Inner membrane protein ybaN [Actinobacillus ureae]
MRLFYIAIGFLCIGLGILGAILPGLPTTPFLLLALFCFSKSSPQLQQWFMRTKIYQKYLKDYDEKRAMTMKQKITILMISAPFCLFSFFVLPNIWGQLALVAVVICQYWYFFCKMETLPAETQTQGRSNT